MCGDPDASPAGDTIYIYIYSYVHVFSWVLGEVHTPCFCITSDADCAGISRPLALCSACPSRCAVRPPSSLRMFLLPCVVIPWAIYGNVYLPHMAVLAFYSNARLLGRTWWCSRCTMPIGWARTISSRRMPHTSGKHTNQNKTAKNDASLMTPSPPKMQFRLPKQSSPVSDLTKWTESSCVC